MKLTSVILPVFNGKDYLEEAIDSILNQTVPDLELILVDDGSTDDSLRICREAAEKDDRVVVISTPNRGVSAARNAGLDICKGDTITFVDADDMLQPNFLERLLPYCTEENSIAAGWMTEDMYIFERYKPAKPKITTLLGPDAAEQSLYQTRILNSPWGKIYRRELFFDPPLRFKEGIRFEDLDIATPLLCRTNKIIIIPEPLYFYRYNPEGFMNSNSDQRTDCLKVTEGIIEWVKENRPQLLPAALSRHVSASFHVFSWVVKERPDLMPLADKCFETLIIHRKSMLRDPKVRWQNKAGLLITFGGYKFTTRFFKAL